MKKHMNQQKNFPKQPIKAILDDARRIKKAGESVRCLNDLPGGKGRCQEYFTFRKLEVLSKKFKYRNWCPNCTNYHKSLESISDLCD